MAKRKKAKKKAKKKGKKKTLRHHAKTLHAIGKDYIKHTLKAVELHTDKRKKEKIKKHLKAMEKALKSLVKLESR